jgi:hypothetical protein
MSSTRKNASHVAPLCGLFLTCEEKECVKTAGDIHIYNVQITNSNNSGIQTLPYAHTEMIWPSQAYFHHIFSEHNLHFTLEYFDFKLDTHIRDEFAHPAYLIQHDNLFEL